MASSEDSNLEVLARATQNICAGENSRDQALHYQSSGADKGYLILEKRGKLFIDAMGAGNLDAAVCPVALEDCNKVSAAVVRYVARTNEVVVLNEDDDLGIFTGDPYFERDRPKSILCLPVFLKNIPIGVLYLENTLVTGVFTLDKLELLKLLSSHMVYVRKLEYLMKENTTIEKNEISPALIEPLTKRELQVLELIAEGLSNREIARTLQLSANTVKMHVMNIYGKLEVSRRVQAVNKAKKLKLIM